MTTPGDGEPTVQNRWWIDTDKRKEIPHPTRPPVGSRFFDIGYEFDQEQAKQRLTDVNLKLLAEAESAQDCLSRARKRRLVTVLPEVSIENGERVLVIPPDAGYGPVSQPLRTLGA